MLTLTTLHIKNKNHKSTVLRGVWFGHHNCSYIGPSCAHWDDSTG